MKRILWYLRGTLDFGLLLHWSSTTELRVYTDADWAGCLDTHAVHLKLCRVPKGQPCLLVVEAPASRLLLQRRGRVPRRGKRRG